MEIPIRKKGRGVRHGYSGTKEYQVWAKLIQRCENVDHPRYGDYGGRGIMVCERWRHNFVAFIEDVGWRPLPGLSIDRIDNDGNYEPGNCRWATRLEQAQNRPAIRRRPTRAFRRNIAAKITAKVASRVWAAVWTVVDGVIVFRSGTSRYVAVPRNGKKTARKFEIIDLNDKKKWIVVLTKREAINWLQHAARPRGDRFRIAAPKNTRK